MSKTTETARTPEELQALLADIRARIAAVDHEAFGGDCEAFGAAVADAVPAEEMSLLLHNDPLVGNLCCLFMRAGEDMVKDQIAQNVTRMLAGQLNGMRVELMRVSAGRDQHGPKKPPTA